MADSVMPSGFLSETNLHKQQGRAFWRDMELEASCQQVYSSWRQCQETILSYLRSELPQSAPGLRNSLPKSLWKCSFSAELFVYMLCTGGCGLRDDFSASCCLKKIWSLNRHKAFWYSTARAWTGIRLAFTSPASVWFSETALTGCLMLAIV